METLIAMCHHHGIRLLLDLVVNHTSDQHAWFRASRSSRHHPQRDWYIWRPPRYNDQGERIPPNNWRRYFSGSAWEWDEHTQEYYLHLFAKEMPDLNWENEEVRRAIYETVLRFWLDKGVDGFRVDCANLWSKPPDYPDVPVVEPDSFEQPGFVWANGPRIHEFLREMNTKVLDHYDCVTVGELPHTSDPAHVRRFVSAGDRQLNMVHQLDIVDCGQHPQKKYWYTGWKLSAFKTIVARWQTFIEGTDAWTTTFLENHDQGRSVSRFGSDAKDHRVTSAKMLALMLGTLTGTLFLYQGQELGMINVPETWSIDKYQDIETVDFYRDVEARCGGDEVTMAHALRSIRLMGRDNARTPMQWDDGPHAGFTTRIEGGWTQVHDSYREINVSRQRDDPASVLHFWRDLIALRTQDLRKLLVRGTFAMVDPDNENTFVFTKTYGKEMALVVLNFTAEEQKLVVLPNGNWRFRLGNYADVVMGEVIGPAMIVLRAYEGRLYLGEN